MAELVQTAEQYPRSLPTLTGMRFISASLVFLSHASRGRFFADQEFSRNFITIFDQAGFAAVGFFFMLSGFIMTWSVRPGDTPTIFWRRRFFRIFPNHLVTFIAAFALLTWVSGVRADRSDTVLNLFLLHTWVPSLQTIAGINSITWSIAVELPFYLCFPYLLRLLNRIRPERLWTYVGVLTAAVFAMPLVATLLPGTPVLPGANFPEKQFWFIYFFPPVRMLEFVIGILLARIVLTRRRVPAMGLGGAAAVGILGASVVSPLVSWPYHLVASMVIPLGLLVLAGALTDVRRRQSWLARPRVVKLGRLSYAVYLWHIMVLVYGHELLSGELDNHAGTGTQWGIPAGLAVVALLYAVTLSLAWALHTYVEMPMYRRFATAGRWRKANRAAPVSPAVGQAVPGGAEPDADPEPGTPSARTPARPEETPRPS